MTATPLFHVGVLVDDLGAAVRRFGDVLGLTFGEATTHLAHVTERDHDGQIQIRVVYSLEGPPFLELIESHASGVFGHHHEGLHHVGAYQDDVEQRIRELHDAGVHSEAVFSVDGRILGAYLDGANVFGTRIEIVQPRESVHGTSSEQTV